MQIHQMKLQHKKLHPRFTLNSISYTELELLQEAQRLIKEGEDFEKSIGSFLLEWLNEENTVLVTTSGSTGKPKQIRLQKKQMKNSALATATFFNLKEGNTALHCLSTDFIAGKMMLVRAMEIGLELYYVSPNAIALDTNIKYDFAAMVPLQLEVSLVSVNSIKKLLIGGAPMPKGLKEKVKDKTVAIFETYGMTETITHIAIKPINKTAIAASVIRNGLSENFSKTFKTLPNITITTDKRGCLVIHAEKLSEEVVVTNDLVKIISATEFQYLGRFDNIINSGGIKLIPEEIETKLISLLKTPYFVVGIPDNKLGQKLVLILEGKEIPENLTSEIAALKSLTKYQIPKEVFLVPKFVEANGKVQRKETLKLIDLSQ
ncbi:MAG: AMP-binding protein [Cellulophaga sp.]